MQKSFRLKFPCPVEWKAVFYDTGKFYSYLVVLYALGAILAYLHAYWVLEPYKMDIGMDINIVPMRQSPDIREIIDSSALLARTMSFCLFVLTCFGVFFSIPPKDFKHIVIVAVLVFSPLALIEFYKMNFLAAAYGFCMLSGFILPPWILSLAWHEFRTKRKKPSQI